MNLRAEMTADVLRMSLDAVEPGAMEVLMTNHSETETNEARFRECEEALNYRFRDQGLLETCLTHASVSKTRLSSNERLEFLGDAILGAIVCEMLYRRFPDYPEGELTRIKSILVSGATCAEQSRQLGLDSLLLLGKGLSTHNEIPASVMGAAFESIVAGIYLDGGMDAAREFVERFMLPEAQRVTDLEHARNYKSLLQQLSQKIFGDTPVYRLIDEKGPDHSKCFQVSAVIGTHAFPAAWGPSKKEAEQSAAQNALAELEDRVSRDDTD